MTLLIWVDEGPNGKYKSELALENDKISVTQEGWCEGK
jgi:hypothetical protein